MTRKELIVALGLIAIASPVSATSPELDQRAPAGGPDTKYCMRVEPATGTLIEKVRCWTRDEWADKGVDVDEDWASEGVAIIEAGVRRPAKG